MKNDYNKLRASAQKEVCEQFVKIYPQNNTAQIHNVFFELDPTVEWDDNIDGSGEYKIWEVWKGRFEKILFKL